MARFKITEITEKDSEMSDSSGYNSCPENGKYKCFISKKSVLDFNCKMMKTVSLASPQTSERPS